MNDAARYAWSGRESSIRKIPYRLFRVYGLPEPGPVVLVTTADRGKANIISMSWHTIVEFDPPLVGCVISSRNHTFGTLRETAECVINIPAEMAAKVVGCGNTSGRNVGRFEAFRPTPAPASLVSPLLISKCYANLECR